MSQIAPSSARQRCLPERAAVRQATRSSAPFPLGGRRRAAKDSHPWASRSGSVRADHTSSIGFGDNRSKRMIRPLRSAPGLQDHWDLTAPRPPATLWYLRALSQVSDRQIAQTDGRTSAIADHALAYKNRATCVSSPYSVTVGQGTCRRFDPDAHAGPSADATWTAAALTGNSLTPRLLESSFPASSLRKS